MAAARKAQRRLSRIRPAAHPRYTVDASVFVNAFNPHEGGHAESLAILAAIQERGDPVIVPALVLPEIASAVARASDDSAGALQYADFIARRRWRCNCRRRRRQSSSRRPALCAVPV